jgi:hypothetical protein
MQHISEIWLLVCHGWHLPLTIVTP